MVRTFNLEEASEFLHLHPDTLQQMAKHGEIPAAKPGKRWVFIEEDLVDWLRDRYRKDKNQCSGNAVTFGGSISSTMEDAFDALVGRQIERKRRSTTTDSRLNSGNRAS
ncbi:helix-turn-helix domain-containing protein [Acidithiobacillus caldus]|uniref:helix-turn-helix domain-containing protein n=1 Tax=Acidithiobacillus caldus TaxID=33059 RepID=UPI00098387F0|nr:helix-turn-helix domain-containing protein [Acidithiobacillus caldus]